MKWNLIRQFLIRHGVKLAVILASVGISLTAGALYHRHSTFEPQSESDHAFRDNEVIFPGQEQASQHQDTPSEEDDSEVWQKEEEVLEHQFPKNQNQAPQLFEDSRMAGIPDDLPSLLSTSPLPNLPTDERERQNPTGSDSTPVTVIVPEQGEYPTDSTSVPFGGSALPSSGIGGSSGNPVPSGTSEATRQPASSSSTSLSPSSKTVQPDSPAVRPSFDAEVPDQSDSPTRPTVDHPQSPTINPSDHPQPTGSPLPSTPDDAEPQLPVEPTEPQQSYADAQAEAEKAELYSQAMLDIMNRISRHKTDSEANPAIVTPFPAEGLSDASTVTFNVSTPSFADQMYFESFYRGEPLTYEKVLHALMIQASVTLPDGTDAYYPVTGALEHLVELTYPETAIPDDSGQLDISIRIRANEQSEWNTYTQSLTIYDQKLLFYDETGKALPLLTTCLNEEETSCLWSSQAINTIVSGTTEADASNQPNRIFSGWSLTPDGEDIGVAYTGGSSSDRIVRLYARPTALIPDGMMLELETVYPSDDPELPVYPEFFDYSELTADEITFQVLSPKNPEIVTAHPLRTAKAKPRQAQLETLEVPYGIHRLKGELQLDTLILPETTRILELQNLQVRQSFQVASGNPCFFSTKSGLLLDASKESLLAIPSQVSVEIPDTIRQIACHITGDAQQVLTFTSEVPPECTINYKLTGEATLLVPDTAYADYLAKWLPSETLQSQIRTVDPAASEGMYLAEDGSVVQHTADGELLCRLPLSGSAVYRVSDTIRIIGSDVLSGRVKETTLVIPSSVRRIEAHAIDTDQLTVLQLDQPDAAPSLLPSSFYGDRPPVIEILSAQNDTVAEVLRGQLSESFEGTISELSDQVMTDGSGTYRYIERNGQKEAILTEAAPDLDTYTIETLPPDLILTGIADGAFRNCHNLSVVELPDSVTAIGNSAFEGCENLEGFVSMTSESEIRVGEHAFSGCTRLRFAAFNSDDVIFADPEDAALPVMDEQGMTVGHYALLLPITYLHPEQFECDDDGYQTYLQYGFSYELSPQSSGFLLYANDNNEDASDLLTHVVGATTDIAGTIDLKENTLAILPMVFADCHNPFRIGDAPYLGWIFNSAFFDATGFLGNTETDGLLDLSQINYLEDLSFYGCTALTDLWVGSTIEQIPDGCFEGCALLETVEFDPDSQVWEIGNNAFAGTSLREIVIPYSVQQIKNMPFSDTTTSIVFEGATPPALILDYPGDEFYWKSLGFFGTNEDLTITIEDATEELYFEYIQLWKYNLLGFSDASQMYYAYYNYYADEPMNKDELSELLADQIDADTLDSERIAYQFLGLEMESSNEDDFGRDTDDQSDYNEEIESTDTGSDPSGTEEEEADETV